MTIPNKATLIRQQYPGERNSATFWPQPLILVECSPGPGGGTMAHSPLGYPSTPVGLEEAATLGQSARESSGPVGIPYKFPVGVTGDVATKA